MIEIERITQAKKGKSRRIEFEDGEEVTLLMEVAMKCGWRVGDKVSEVDVERAVAESLEIECREAAWQSIARRPRTRIELARALRKKEFPPELVEKIVEELRSRGFANDAEIATQLAGERARRRDGARKIEMKLRAKGVDKETATQAAREASPPERERENAAALLEKWNRRSKPEEPAKRRQAAAAFLMRKGYDAEIVWESVRRMLGGDD